MQRGQPKQQIDYETWNQILAEHFYGAKAGQVGVATLLLLLSPQWRQGGR